MPDKPTRFPFRFDPTYRRLARLFGVTPERAWVELGEEKLDVRYGPWRVRTPVSNVAGVEATGPYAFFKTAGSARLAITDRGLTRRTEIAARAFPSIRRSRASTGAG